MGKQSQLELFKLQQYQSDIFNKDEYRPKFFTFIRLHEKAISITIIFFITWLISFSLGVERGKRLASVTTQIEPENLRTKQTLMTERLKDKAGQILLTDHFSDGKLEDKEEKKEISKYTIQVATFKTKVYAQKEADRLKKKGLKTLIIPKGNYICVCVGNFSEKQEAKLTLNQLKKNYQDCFIRRL